MNPSRLKNQTMAQAAARQRAAQPAIEQSLPRRGTGSSASSPILQTLPEYVVEPGIFDAILVPDGTADPADGTSAAFLLRRIRVPDDSGQELTVTGVAMTLKPTDSAGSSGAGAHGIAAASCLGWGDTAGMLAAVVVGINLPIQDGAWTRIASALPGIETNATASQNRSSLRKYLAVGRFAPGKLNDTAPATSEPRWSYVPGQQKVTFGQSLDIAIIVRSSQIVNASGSARYIVGLADVRVTTFTFKNTQNFSEQ